MSLPTLRYAVRLGLMAVAWTVAAGCQRPPESGVHLQYAFWGSLAQQKTELALVATFEKENPGIHVDTLPIGARYAEKIQAMMVGGVAPDVMMVEMGRYDEWAVRGALLDVTDLVDTLDREDELLPVPRRAFQRDGRYFAAPTSAHGVITFCNLDALRAAGIPFSPEGWTWEQIAAFAPRLASRHGDPRAPTEYALLMPTGEAVFACHGAQLFDDIEHPARATADSPACVGALNAYRDLYHSPYTVPDDVSGDQGTYQLFRDGRVALFFSGRWRTPEFAGQTKFAWDVVPFPAGPAGHATYHGGTGLAIGKHTRHAEEARRFLQFYAGRTGAEIAMRGGRTVPVFARLAYGADFLSLRPPEAIGRFADTMQAGAATAPLYGPGAAEVANIFYAALHEVAYKKTPPARACEAMQEDLTRWLQRRGPLPTPPPS